MSSQMFYTVRIRDTRDVSDPVITVYMSSEELDNLFRTIDSKYYSVSYDGHITKSCKQVIETLSRQNRGKK